MSKSLWDDVLAKSGGRLGCRTYTHPSPALPDWHDFRHLNLRSCDIFLSLRFPVWFPGFFPGGEILKLVVLYEFLNSALSFAIHWSFLEHLPATAMAKTRVHRQHTRHTPHSKLFTDWTIGPHLFGQQFPFLFDQRVGFCWQCHSVTYVWAQKKRCC